MMGPDTYRGYRAVTVTHLNPPSLHRSPAFSQGTIIPAGSKIVIVGGQNGLDADGKLVGDSVRAQSEQALRNVLAVLEAAGATQADVAKLTIYLVEGSDINEGFAAAQEVWGPYPTAITGLFVSALAAPDRLVEIEAIAALPG
jgi:2-iminobutanoate/2-iminopropanoate deaminase